MRTTLSALNGPIRRRAAFRRRMGLSGLAAAHPMLTRGFKDGNNSWIDVMPSRFSPAMRITHTIGADLRKPPTFDGFAGLGAPPWGGPPWAPGRGPTRPSRAVKCIQSGVGNMFCWNVMTGEHAWPPNPLPARPRTPAAERPSLKKVREDVEEMKRKLGMQGINCRAAGSGRVFCWDDESMPVASAFYQKPGMEGLSGMRRNRGRRRR